MSVLLFILQLFPLVLAAIQQIEATAPVPKTGPEKLQLLSEVVTMVLQADPLPTTLISQQKLIAIVTAITNAAVTFYNLVGVFKKSS